MRTLIVVLGCLFPLLGGISFVSLPETYCNVRVRDAGAGLEWQDCAEHKCSDGQSNEDCEDTAYTAGADEYLYCKCSLVLDPPCRTVINLTRETRTCAPIDCAWTDPNTGQTDTYCEEAPLTVNFEVKCSCDLPE